MYKATLRNLLIVISWAVWLSSCSATPPAASGQRLVLTDDALNFRYTLSVTTRNARDESGTPRDGTLTIVTTNTPTGQRQDISTTDQLTPNWLIPFAGQVSIATQTTERWLIADDCRRDAGVLPMISMRELLGPLPGFVRSDNQLFSQDGAPLWQSWAASALPDATGAIQSATGHGTGKIFIPGGEVISGDISWDYQRIPAPSMTIPSQHCNDVVLDTLTLPPTWTNRRMYGGAFLAESPQAPARSATDLRDTLSNNGWKITTLDTHTTPIVIQASSQHDTIRVFVVSNQNSGSDITIIAVTP
jgi:hypothetical protein